MAIHKSVVVTIDPTNAVIARSLKIENEGNNVKLTAGFITNDEIKAVIPWRWMWSLLFLKSGEIKYFDKRYGLLRARKVFILRSEVQFYFQSEDYFDYIRIKTKDLKEALLEIKKTK